MLASINQAVISTMGVITTSCGALERVAKTADNIAAVAEERSGEYLDTARIKRAKNYQIISQELDALGIASVQPTLLLPK